MMLRTIGTAAVVGPLIWLMSASQVSAQTVAPPAPAPEKGEKTIVINPTVDECNKGWSAGLRWSKEQFDLYCARLRVSK